MSDTGRMPRAAKGDSFQPGADAASRPAGLQTAHTLKDTNGEIARVQVVDSPSLGLPMATARRR